MKISCNDWCTIKTEKQRVRKIGKAYTMLNVANVHVEMKAKNERDGERKWGKKREI